MTRMMASIGDRMLAAVLPRTTAGACTGDQGQPCSYTKNGHCTGGWYILTLCQGRYACNGTCTISVTCSTRKVGPC